MDPRFSWMSAAPSSRVMSILNRHGQARFVGGCVRDSLLGAPPGAAGRTDIDIATDILPQDVQRILTDEAIRVVPTGIDHGTVTAIVDKVPLEITTLRSDVTTDGRRATVAFTKDWHEDAQRRDFTINALYLSTQGEVFDPAGGVEDLKARRVRFIGDAAHRIEEDALRILRFLRFSARFAEDLDPLSWDACIAAKDALNALSKERIWQETAKIITHSRGTWALVQAAEKGLLAEILPKPAEVAILDQLHRNEAEVAVDLALAALWPQATRAEFQAAFKPPKAVLGGVEAIRRAYEEAQQESDIQVLLYHHGAAACRGAGALARARGQSLPGALDAVTIATTAIPSFPFRGQDILDRGVAPGPDVTRLLKAIEAAWMKAGFPQEAEELTRLLDQVLAAESGTGPAPGEEGR